MHDETISEQDRKRIIQWADDLNRPINLVLIDSDDPRTKDFTRFCRAFSTLVPKVSITSKKGVSNALPEIRIGKRIVYQSLPLGPELAPFLEALEIHNGDNTEWSSKIRDHLEKIKIPAMMKLFITPQCPFCPNMVRRLVPLIFASEHLRLLIIDGFLFPEIAQHNKIQSAPTLLLGEKMRWTGVTPLNDIVHMLHRHDFSDISTASIRNIIDNGEASRMVEMILQNGKIPSAFLNLLVHEKWSVRLGAMVVVEELAEKDRHLAATIIEPIGQHLARRDEPTKGDMLYLFGLVGTRSTLPIIQGIMKTSDHSELHEAGREAMAAIQERNT